MKWSEIKTSWKTKLKNVQNIILENVFRYYNGILKQKRKIFIPSVTLSEGVMIWSEGVKKIIKVLSSN